MDEKQLRKAVLDELDFEPSIDATSIGVTAHDGIVTLTGYVSSCAEKIEAQKAVRRIKGVRAIADEINVRYANDKKTSDDEIAKRALDILGWYGVTLQNMIQVTVQEGWITLSGDVIWQYQKKAAEDAVQKLSGVTGITNSISIMPRIDTSDIKRKIEDTLIRHAKVEAESIRVIVREGNRVTLEGTVDSWDERDAVENVAWSIAGVQSVDDRLTIVR